MDVDAACEFRIAGGAMSIFAGHHTVHRVIRVGGAHHRLVAVLCYNREPGVAKRDEVRKLFWECAARLRVDSLPRTPDPVENPGCPHAESLFSLAVDQIARKASPPHRCTPPSPASAEHRPRRAAREAPAASGAN